MPTRFIPTPVGNTSVPLPTAVLITVHPHACGEHLRWGPSVQRRPGSSPRLWGTRRECASSGHAKRFIPTPVGNTALSSDIPAFISVHPHACGEHGRMSGAGCCKTGSSPRLWGTQAMRIMRRYGARFIPTPVGNTRNPSHNKQGNAVHPHACGEHSSQIYC